MANIVCKTNNKSPVWTTIDLVRWKVIPRYIGGGWPYLRSFKDGWVKHNRMYIKQFARKYKIPPVLLAGTAWIEAGGDPQFIDSLAFNVRAFDWSGPKWVDDNLTITNNPNKTSFGAISMQLRTAARTMRIDLKKFSYTQMKALAKCLETDVFNIKLVARHYVDIIQRDFPGISTSQLTDEQIMIAGARYNRGVGLSLKSIKTNMSYGKVILKIRPRIKKLLKD